MLFVQICAPIALLHIICWNVWAKRNNKIQCSLSRPCRVLSDCTIPICYVHTFKKVFTVFVPTRKSFLAYHICWNLFWNWLHGIIYHMHMVESDGVPDFRLPSSLLPKLFLYVWKSFIQCLLTPHGTHSQIYFETHRLLLLSACVQHFV